MHRCMDHSQLCDLRVGPVAVLGAGGTMGLPIARNLARAGFEVRAWNRSAEKARPLAAEGVTIAGSPAEAADGAGLLLTMLADAGAVLAATDGDKGALSAAAPPPVWVQMSTIGEEGTDSCAAIARRGGIAFVDAPVLGTRQPADEGKLVVLASGPAELRDPLQPLFEAVGRRTLWVGEAGAGTRLKLVTNCWVLMVVEGGAEAIALAEGLGVDPSLLFDALAGGSLDLPYLRIKGKRMTERNFEPLFRLSLAAKDARLVRDAAARRGLDLPVVAAVQQRLEQGAAEHGEEDFSATYLTSTPKR
jgi:3-hydroxyisobutyrate dehydrogenase